MTTFTADSKGPKAVDVVCSNCACAIKPDDLKRADARRVDRTDGTWAIAYDHGEGDCTTTRLAAANAGPKRTTLLAVRR